MRKFIVVTLLGIVAIALSGCRSFYRNDELLRSFEDISAGHAPSGFFKVAQHRTMSINGQLPFLDIGPTYFYRPQRGNLASVGLLWDEEDLGLKESNGNAPDSNNNNDYSKVASYQQIQTYGHEKESGNAASAVLLVRSNLLALAQESAFAVNLSASIETAKAERQTLLEEVKMLDPEAGDQTAADRSRLNTRISELSSSIDEQTKELGNVNERVATARGAVEETLRKENLFVFRWKADKNKLGSISLTGRAYSKYKNELGRSGFVIMAGMRSRKLHLSQRDAMILRRAAHRNHLVEWYPLRPLEPILPFHHAKSIHIVTHLVETKSEAYISEQSLVDAAKLSVETKSETKRTLTTEQTLALEAATEVLEQLANSGIIGTPEVSRFPVAWPWIHYKRYKDEERPEPGWIPVMAVTSRVVDLDDVFKGRRLD